MPCYSLLSTCLCCPCLLLPGGVEGVVSSPLIWPSMTLGSLKESGEFWMLLAAQSMAVGTVMVRWVGA